MTETLSQFITRRKTEIRKQIKELRAEYKSLKAAAAVSMPVGKGKKNHNPGTIKDMVCAILSKKPNGATANEILAILNKDYGKDYVRSSLSPQLSRLKQEGVLELFNGAWVLSKAELNLMADDNGDALDEADLIDEN